MLSNGYILFFHIFELCFHIYTYIYNIPKYNIFNICVICIEGGSFNISKEKIQQFSDSGSISVNVPQKTIK